MSITFYHSPYSSAAPVAWALAELEVPHERVAVDLRAGDQRKPEFLALNPNGKVPTLVVDGTPLFEALGILLWLGDRFGAERGLWPAVDAPLRLEAISWSAWAYVTYGGLLQRLAMATGRHGHPELHQPAQVTQTQQELAHLQGILDARLRRGPYVLGDRFTLADLTLAGAVGYGAAIGAPVDAHPHIVAWLQRCRERPAHAKYMQGF